MKNNIKNKFLQDSRGVAALLTIVIVGAAALIMAYSTSVLGLGELEMGYSSQKGDQALLLADGCIEEALNRLRLDAGYTGSNLYLGDGSCIIGVSGVGGSRVIFATGTVDIYTKVIRVEATLSGSNVDVTTWEEVVF
ncbi:MAG: hypothetical protein GF349_03545 [Candidatus Magasanikbacteria bacterium]|nr:hypothetical protein [Candidatus Magasanikbacteria bacterium]